MSIYFGSLDVTSTVESPEFERGALLNSLGGALSLFLGVSIIMIFEVVEVNVRLVYSMICSIVSFIVNHF